VGLSLLYCHWDNEGRLLANPVHVTQANAHRYQAGRAKGKGNRLDLLSHLKSGSACQVHHLKHWRVCSLKHLAVVTVALHSKLTSGAVKRLPMPPGGQQVVPPMSVA
jgi:hypothetical protein